jgi:hypothetical protein
MLCFVDFEDQKNQVKSKKSNSHLLNIFSKLFFVCSIANSWQNFPASSAEKFGHCDQNPDPY